MRVEVKIHRRAAAGVAAWRERISAHPPCGENLWQAHLDAMFAEFVRTEGLPADAAFVSALRPPRYVWRFAGDC